MRKYLILLIMFAFVGVAHAQEVSINLDTLTEGGKLSSIFTLCPWDAARNESLGILP